MVRAGGWNINKNGFNLEPTNGTAVKVWDDTNCIVYEKDQWQTGVLAYFKQDVAASWSRTYKITPYKPYYIVGGGKRLLTKAPVTTDTPINDGAWITGNYISNDNIYSYITFVDGAEEYITPA